MLIFIYKLERLVILKNYRIREELYSFCHSKFTAIDNIHKPFMWWACIDIVFICRDKLSTPTFILYSFYKLHSFFLIPVLSSLLIIDTLESIQSAINPKSFLIISTPLGCFISLNGQCLIQNFIPCSFQCYTLDKIPCSSHHRITIVPSN